MAYRGLVALNSPPTPKQGYASEETLLGVKSLLAGTNLNVYSETPSGVIDGINRTFTVLNSYTAGTMVVFLNGLRQQPGATNDYTETGATTIQFVSAPQLDDKVMVDYTKVA